jgi:hypothetical protein
MNEQLESIKLKLATIAPRVIPSDKKKLLALPKSKKICSPATLYKYLVQGDAKSYTICKNIYLFLNELVEARQAELDKL